VTKVWVGIDAGKQHHWAVALDGEGRILLSRRVVNDQTAIEELLTDVGKLSEEAAWAIDMSDGKVALMLALLCERNQHVVYVPGKAVNRAADGYRAEGKTDAKDARIIADQARLRRDFATLRPPGELLTELATLVAYRRDLSGDQHRIIVRLREHLTAIFPALERALDLTCKGPLHLLARWQTPSAIRRAGAPRIAAHLSKHRIPNAAKLADKAVAAAKTQTVALPGEKITAAIVAELAERVLEQRQRLKDLDNLLEETFAKHPQAKILTSLPGLGTLLAAEFIVAVGDLANFTSADHLAAYAGLAPVLRDSGRITGNLHRPQRYNRTLMRVFYLSAHVAAGRPGPSRDYYQRKRAEGKRHVQALIALARRRVNVIYAMLRDNKPFAMPAQPQPQAA
jgi:transposase